ncbi:MAG TPA: DUF1292 domain-containing protein [Clostridia bacterium]|jgi:hypothetical protein|nr:MAG: hypothetical protein BWX78_01330 [Firmicutes bacterium ADurb.Bin099]HNZ41286.1 DUF1292 domain-containing protein [Clostridia bacterium]HPY97772.1 DUF1292 domain-containing protein [Clostridia bacterium]HQC67662.1 DUF1292 domain-containing protein [Clostridia bacterium]
MDNERDNIIVMEDDEGNPIEMTVLEMLEYDDRTYVLMQSADESEEDAYIFEYEEDKDDAILTPVEDEQLLDELFELFVEKMDSDFDDEEEEE